MGVRYLCVVVGLAGGIASAVVAEPIASIHVEGSRLLAQALVPATGVAVSVTGPAGFARTRRSSEGPAVLELAEAGTPPRDGLYVYEVRLGAAVESESDAPATERRTQSGVFQVVDGQVRMPAAADERREARAPAPAPDAQVIVGDVSVQGRLCAGDDCTASEPFGTATLLLNEQNNRIRIDDSSTATGAPNNDWQLTFNDSAANGAGKFALEDLTGAKVPFTVMAGAPNNSLFVSPAGRVGIGTATPEAGAGLTITDFPAGIALRPTSSFDNGVWLIQASNTQDFRILQSSDAGFLFPLTIHGEDVGLGVKGLFGNLPPAAPLHVQRLNGSAKLLVEEKSSTVIGRNLLQLKNNGAVTLRFDNTSNGTSWGFGSIVSGNKFFMSASGAPSLSMTLDPAGNMTIAGALTQSSDRNAKDDILAVDPAEVLAKLAELPIATWRYKGDDATHVGPMAQDFHAAFGLGPDDKHIAPADLAGLSLAAVQALRAEVAAKDRRVEALEADAAAQQARLRELAARLSALEGAAAPR